MFDLIVRGGTLPDGRVADIGIKGDRITAVRGLERAQAAVGPLVVEVKLPRMGQARSSSYEGEGYVIVRHPRTEVVQEALQTIVTQVRVEAG